MATTVKFAYAGGFAWTQTASSQSFFGFGIFGLVFLVMMLFGKRPEKMTTKQVFKLLGTGIVGCFTNVLYGYSLTMLPVAVAITLLFQFTWIGIVIQVITTRRRPHTAEVVAGLIILGGTLLAGGVLSGEYFSELNPIGIVCALLSAVSCAMFMFLSSKVETKMPFIQRGLFICAGSSLLAIIVCPDYFTSGILIDGIWKYGIILGMFGLFIPVIMFGIGTPHLPTGISTIMASSELPCAILISVFILGEPIDLFQTIGIIIILGGVTVSQIPYLQLLRGAAKQKAKTRESTI